MRALIVLLVLHSVFCFGQSHESKHEANDYKTDFWRIYNEQGSIDSLELCFREWTTSDPRTISPYYGLINEYIRRNIKLDRAFELAMYVLKNNLKSSGGVRQLKPRFDEYVSLFYHQLAQIEFRRDRLVPALAYLQASKAFRQSVTDSSVFLLEGKIWQHFLHNEHAERSYLRAYLSGSAEAGDSLRSMFISENGTINAFATYMNILAEDVLEKAPEIQSVDTHGNDFRLSALRGKIVVLTFWFIGCPGCINEEKALRRMSANIDTTAVALVSITKESAPRVMNYFDGDGIDFYPTTIPSAQKTLTNYGISAMPAHIIIDKEGRIAARLTGGSPQCDDIILRLIEAACLE